MILKLKDHSSPAESKELFELLISLSIVHKYVEKENIVVIPKFNEYSLFKNQKAIKEIFEIETPYQLSSNVWKKKTSVFISDIEISDDTFSIIAGPCSVENEDQIFKTAEFISSLGIKFIRGGAFKPRTSPYSFRGLGKDGLKLLQKAASSFNLKIVTEILDVSLLEETLEYADILQVGSRNMQNFFMLDQIGKTNKPVLLKRGMNARVYEWLLAAEYILSGGNQNVILCERGIRSFDPLSRNVTDIGAISLIKELSHLPIILDPSHGTGYSNRVSPMALAGIAAGADGLIIEIHPDPSKALSDKEQALDFNTFKKLVIDIEKIIPALPYNKKSNQESPTILKIQSN